MSKNLELTQAETKLFENYYNYLLKWIKEKVLEANKNGVIVGISGGIDSAVVAKLAHDAFPLNSVGVTVNLNNFSKEKSFIKEIVQLTKIKFVTLTFNEILTDIRKKIDQVTSLKVNELAIANMKPRMRMMIFYYVASKFNYLVLGTDNKAELYIGYFTKYGDGGVDILPLANLNKSEVKKLAKYLGFANDLINQEPSADLWINQTDEKELGINYDVIDKYLNNEKIDQVDKMKINQFHSLSEHKRNFPPKPDYDLKNLKNKK